MSRKPYGTAGFLAVLLITTVGSLLAAAPVAADPTRTVTITAEADAFVTAAQPGSNFGTVGGLAVSPSSVCDTALYIGGGPVHAFLRFDLTAIPAGATIQSAHVQVTAYNGFAYGGDGNQYLHHVPNDGWSETGLTWNNRPGASSRLGLWWAWYGFPFCAPFKGQQNHGTAIDPAVVAAERAGDGKLSLRVNSPGYWVSYYSREVADPEKRPRLIVRYCTPDPTLSWLAPLGGPAHSMSVSDTLAIRFAWENCSGFVRDESVMVIIRDQANPDYPVAAWVYGYNIAIDEGAGEYSLMFRPTDYQLSPGTHLAVEVYFGYAPAGVAEIHVTP